MKDRIEVSLLIIYPNQSR